MDTFPRFVLREISECPIGKEIPVPLESPRVLRSQIDGVAAETTSRSVTSANPANLAETVAFVQLESADVIVDACRAAKWAQRSWAEVPVSARTQAIANLSQLVEANAETLAWIITREVGKPIREAREEVRQVIDTCAFFMEEGHRLNGHATPTGQSGQQILTSRRPIGSALVITRGGIPVASPMWYLIPALLCGNSVVWKPSTYAAACADALYELLIHAGIPAGVLNVVWAEGADTFQGLDRALAAGLVDKVAFNGSAQVGAEIGRLCGGHLQTPCFEFGGKTPMVVAEDADLDLAVSGALVSGFGGGGQQSTSLGTVLVHETVREEFLRRFDLAVRAARIGDPAQEVLFGPLLDERIAVEFEKHLGALGYGHTTFGSAGTGRITAANPRPGFVGDPESGLYYHPTIVDGVQPGDGIFDVETLGPLVGVLGYTDLTEAIELSNAPGYAWGAVIYTEDPQQVFRYRLSVNAATVSVNSCHLGGSEVGRYFADSDQLTRSRQSARGMLEEFSRWQSFTWNYSGLPPETPPVILAGADPDFRLAP
jgi:aldehyde dehydrogenase (NAD+)